MNSALTLTQTLLQEIGINGASLKPMSTLTLVLGLVLLLLIIHLIFKKIFEPIILKITRKTPFKWDDIVFRPDVIRWVWILIPCMVAYYSLPACLELYPKLKEVSMLMVNILLILTLMMIVIEGVKTVFLLIADRENIDTIAEQMNMARDNGEEFVYQPSHSLKGLQQMMIILIAGVAGILIVSLLLGKNPLIIFSGLGAAAAVLMLVFQDSILGVVAGIQLTANDMLQPGDWITSTKYGANGIVREVTLAAVKVQNYDKTIVTIPPYKLLSEGFQNWRGMQASKGRRVMRAIYIDQTSIRYATEEEKEMWDAAPWRQKDEQIGPLVNLTVFRQYLEHYITTLPTHIPNMLFMIRELAPTPEGLPVEIYFFTSSIEWKKYEVVQADVLDQVIAMLPKFGLRIYQRPTGQDIRDSIKETK